MSISDYLTAAAKASVAYVLGSPKIGKMKKFTVSSHTFEPSHLAHMSYEARQGALNVAVKTSLNGSAYYKAGNNTLYVGFYVADSITKEALIVHEATHALFDFKAAKMDIATSEAISYIAQCQYARANNTDPDPESRLWDEGTKDTVFEVGWKLAGKLLNGSSLTGSDVSEMKDAVSQHPNYAANGSVIADFDGI
jgi:hypothetical protein